MSAHIDTGGASQLVDTSTGEITTLDAAAAERRAERITLRLEAIAENLSLVLPMIREAIEERDDLALGYRSPGEYVADRFGASLERLGLDVRTAVVKELTAAGLSTRAIAPVVGVSEATIRRDIRRPSTASGDAVEPTAVATVTPIACEPRKVTGLNGKDYVIPVLPDWKALADAAVTEFPDLAYFRDRGTWDARDTAMTGDDLRRYRERGELEKRLDNLRRSICVAKAKDDGTYRPGTTCVMGEDGEYHMQPMEQITTALACPTCNGSGQIKETTYR